MKERKICDCCLKAVNPATLSARKWCNACESELIELQTYMRYFKPASPVMP